jgi:HPt (histidine-containing phosphotransfer) domain-containing protein
VIEVLRGKNKKHHKKSDPVKTVEVPVKEDLAKEAPAKEEETGETLPENPAADEEFTVLSEAGVDPVKGLESCMNDKVLYIAMLQEFARDAGEKKPELEQFYKEKDWENYTIRVHSVKSSSLLIGAESISKLAKMLESASKREDIRTIEEYYPRFLQEYSKAVELVERHWPMQEGEREGGEL